MKRTWQHHRGISLLELMLSLAIIAILLVTATRYYNMTRSSQHVNEAAQMITAVYAAAQSWLANDQLKSQNMIPDFTNIGILPKQFTNPNINPWGGAITATGQSATSLLVTLTQVPTTDCNELLQQFKEKIPNSSAACDDKQNFNITFQLQ
jgi:prepilin-type N-terminal cleavage/methylation domain-containing protein